MALINLLTLEEASFIIMAILSILLIVSEILGWSNCKPSSVSEYIYAKLACTGPEDENNVATQTPQLV